MTLRPVEEDSSARPVTLSTTTDTTGSMDLRCEVLRIRVESEKDFPIVTHALWHRTTHCLVTGWRVR
jgi:hypothetical protein